MTTETLAVTCARCARHTWGTPPRDDVCRASPLKGNRARHTSGSRSASHPWPTPNGAHLRGSEPPPLTRWPTPGTTPAPASPTKRHIELVEAFLRAHHRPCLCPLDLRAERDGLRCASCDRLFRPLDAPRGASLPSAPSTIALDSRRFARREAETDAPILHAPTRFRDVTSPAIATPDTRGPRP